MKRKNFIKLLDNFSENESKEIKDFIRRFEADNLLYTQTKNKKNKTNNFGYDIPKKFTKATYQEYLETPLWKAIRKRVFGIKGKCCEGCGSLVGIQVHHSVYSQRVFRGETLNGLRVVCRLCHERIHKLKDSTSMNLKQATNSILKEDVIEIKKITVLKRIDPPEKRIWRKPKRNKWVGQYG